MMIDVGNWHHSWDIACTDFQKIWNNLWLRQGRETEVIIVDGEQQGKDF